MANVKITELTAQTTTADATDVLPIVDVAANATKKITVANLITAQARTFTAAQRGEIEDVAVAAGDTTKQLNFATANNFALTLANTASCQLDNPSGLTAGQAGSIFIVQSSAGSHLLSYDTAWDFAGGTAPTLSTAGDAVDRIDYIVRSATSIHAVFTANYS